MAGKRKPAPEPIPLRNGEETFDVRLDRIPEPGAENKPVMAVIGGQTEPVTVNWGIPEGEPVLNQGKEGACFTADVLVRMADGSQRAIADIRLLDEVVTAQGSTGVVTHLMVRPADRGLVRVGFAGHIPLRCTPEHPILTERGYVAAEDLVAGDKVAITRFLPVCDDPIRPHELVDFRHFRGVVSGAVNTGGVISHVAPLPQLLARTPALGRLLGLYLAEGHTTLNKVVWSFGAHERDTLVAETQALVKDVFDAQSRVHTRPSGAINVVLYGKAWRLLFESLIPGTSKFGDKHLSGEAAQGSETYLAALLDGWLAGDGYVRRTEQIGTTVSRRLALDMHAIATALGRRPVLRESDPRPNRHAASRQRRYDLTYGTGGGSNRSARQDATAVWRTVRSVTPEEYDDLVYNIEVEGDHSYVADGIGVHNCVGFGITNELRFNPVPVMGLDADFARQKIYWPAQRDDQWPGGSYEGASPFYEGTSVRAGLEVAQKLGYVGEYRAANNEYELALAMTLGPVVIGVDWYEGMFKPDKRGYIKPTGRKMGGHCCLVIGITVTRGPKGSGYYTIYNSWGPSWGDKGTARIRRVDLGKLIDDGGDAFSIVSRFNPPQPR